MISAIAPVSALLLSVFILIAGHGLMSTLTPLAASSFGFSGSTIGLIGAAYYAGMLAGSFSAAYVLRAAGHIRAFSALTAVGVALVLLMPMVVSPIAWTFARMGHGFCIAALYTTIESWLNTRAPNDWRARILSVYNVMHFAGSAAGQQALGFIPPSNFAVFSIGGMLMALSILPLAFTKADPPAPPEAKRLRVGWLWSVAPTSAVCSFLLGCSSGGFWALGPFWAAQIGYAPVEVALFMSAVIIGCAAGQLPAGYIGDRMDRRLVLAGFAALACLCCLTLSFMTRESTSTIAGFIYGVAIPTMSVMCSAHANDRAGRQHAVEVASSNLFLYCLGALSGPVITAFLMSGFGPRMLFIVNAVVYGGMVAFVLLRIRAREEAPLKQPVETQPIRIK
ncbi:MFS transporter [Terrarubrum flagellatum]|uniref:MFS transporter n=1 Tax=Terrirubrum flagellatum TaxID=2895980 RepID=UPI0031452168